MQPTTVKRLLTAEDAIQGTQTSRSTIYRAIRSGALPVVRFGRAVRIDPADLDDWIERMKVSSGDSLPPAA